MENFIESSAPLQFKFDGDDIISASALIASLNNIIDLLSETTKAKNMNAYAKLNIKAIQHGSFDVWFQVVVKELQTLLTKENIELAADIAGLIVALFALKKFLFGKKAMEVKKNDHGVSVTNINNETKEFRRDVDVFFERPSFDHSIVNIINVALGEKSKGFSLSAEDGSIHINESEYEHMRSTIMEEPIIRTREHTVKEEHLIIKKPDLLGKSQWGFVFRDNAIEASIEDSGWLQSFQGRHIPVQSGSSIVVDLRILSRIDENGEDIIGIRPQYDVTKVYGDIMNPPEQYAFNIGQEESL